MRGWAMIYAAGALLAGVGGMALPEGALWVCAVIVFFIFVVALLLLGLTQAMRSVRD